MHGADREGVLRASRPAPARRSSSSGIFVAIIMAVGSSFAAMNTMYAAVARRAREIGTLRVLGFSRGQHSGQLFPGIGAAVGSGRRAGLPAGAAAQRRHHRRSATAQLFGNGVRLSGDARNHAGRDRCSPWCWAAWAGCSRRAWRPRKRSSRRCGKSKSTMDAELKNLQIDRSKRPRRPAVEVGHALDRGRRAAVPAAGRMAVAFGAN